MKVYIAEPYSSDPVRGVRNAISAADYVMSQGDCPYIPHPTMFWDLVHAHPYEEWLEYDMEWLRVCDELIRLPGASDGAAAEEAEARRLGIKVWKGLAEYINDRKSEHRDS